MNAITGNVLRALAVALLAAIGVATTISSGGGGGGGDGGGMGPSTDLLQITSNNAHDVSSALIVALGLSLDISEFTGTDLQEQSVAGSTRILKLVRADNLASKVSDIAATAVETCMFGGTVTLTSTLADPNTLTVGDQIRAVFSNCDDGEGYVLNGQIDMTVAAIQGDVMTDVFLLGLDITMTGIEIIEDGETIAADGNMTLTVDTLDFPVIVETLEGTELTFAIGSEVLTFSDFEHVFQVDFGVIPEAVLVTATGQLDSATLGGAVNYATTIAVEAFGDDDPHIGQILITGDDSSVRIVINDSTSVTLEVDTNGDGVIDEYIDTTFAALSGNTSSINSSTATTIAREVMHAVTGFGSMAVVSGQQFWNEAPFGQIREQSLSGDIGPIEVACPSGGTATVSGSVASAGLFSGGDSLSAAYTGCGGNGSNLLGGQLDFVVSSYTEAPGSTDPVTTPFQVTGAVTATDLERTALGNVYTGSGAVETSYDYQLTSPSFVFVSASSPSFTVGHNGVDRLLTDAGVSAEITIGVISRSSSGRLTSDALFGAYSYQSLSADMFGVDGDPATGPFSGELLVTADDGGMLAIVALDELNVRLDVDYEGDSIIDTSITTTWYDLQ
jgi:hypothetical protein